MWDIDRQTGFNVLVILFWTVTSLQLAVLAKTLPLDQDQMLNELSSYANQKLALVNNGYGTISLDDDHESQSCDNNADDDRTIYSIETLSTSFDAVAARSTLNFFGSSFLETGSLICSPCKKKMRLPKKPTLERLTE